MKDDTKATHPPEVTLLPNNRPVVPPIYQSVKFTAGGWREIAGGMKPGVFYYSRASNPTVTQLEKLLADLQGRDEAVAVASGMAGIAATFLGHLKSGDHVVLILDSYRPTRLLLRQLLGKFGVQTTLLPVTRLAQLDETMAKHRPRLLFFESPTNPMTRVPDLVLLTETAKRYGALTVLDNTFAGVHQHNRYPVDLFVHSLTKYAGGHGDVLGGAVIGERALIDPIREAAVLLGPSLDAHAAYLLMRGMKTYPLRYRRHSENALEVARFLESQPAVERVFHPGLESHPDHALAKSQLTDLGGIVTLTLKPGLDLGRFVDTLRLFLLTSSLGSTESLIAPVKAFYATDLDDEQRDELGMTDRTFRLSVGLEAVEDLCSDLTRAFEAAKD